MITISFNELAKILGFSKGIAHVYLGHYSLAKYVRLSETRLVKKKHLEFILNPDSIRALRIYLIKRGRPTEGIEELTRYYEDRKMNNYERIR